MPARQNSRTRRGMNDVYHRLLAQGRHRLNPPESPPDTLAALIAEFQARREAGEKLSIRAFCGERKVSQKQFEVRLRQGDVPLALTNLISGAHREYYKRAEVQQAIFLWSQGRRLALHYNHGLIGIGVRRPEDVLLLAANRVTPSPTFHASVGRYCASGERLFAFDLVAEVDYKGDWRRCFKVTRGLVYGLHEQGVKFLVKFSGHSSAHVIVPCRGSNYGAAASAFLGSLKLRKLDLTFKQPQHFLRMPYALHEGTGLVSLPILPDQYDSFDPEMARPENVMVDLHSLEEVLAADNLHWLLG